MEKLRAEFRNGGQANARAGIPSRYFFAPLEPLLVDGAPEHANSGRVQRGSLVALWEWISRDLLPTMARDYTAEMTDLIAADKQKEARQVSSAFQTKVVKSLENTLRSPDTAAQIHLKLATYTASRSAYDDLTKMLCILRARDALAKFDNALPAGLDKVRRRTDRQNNPVAGWLRQGPRRRYSVRAGVGGDTAADFLAFDPPRHQGRPRQRRR